MKLLYLRNGPYKPQINHYNMQEIGFCKAFSDYGWDCDILYYSDSNKNELYFTNTSTHTNINIFWQKGLKFLRTGIYTLILKKDFLNQYDLIITTEYSQIMTLLVSFFHKKVFLYTGPYYNLFKIPLAAFFYDLLFTRLINSRINHIFCKSQLALEYLSKKGYSKLSVLGVGFDPSKYEGIEISDSTKLIQNFLIENKCLLFVGSLDDRKNFPFLLKIFNSIKKLDLGKEFKLVLIGKGKNSYLQKKMQNVPLHIKNDILHIKQIENSQLKFVYPFAKCLLLPSKKEIFGMVLLEAMFFGCVPITTKNGGSTTLIENGENGFIVDSFDEKEWIEIINNILNNEQQRSYLSKQAKVTIQKKFFWSSLAKKVLMEYDKIQ